MSGHIVEKIHVPDYKSVEQYEEVMHDKAPSDQLEDKVTEKDVQCVCCDQKAPFMAAAMLKVEDNTPTTVEIQKKEGRNVWICADCFSYGVRPKFIRFGEVKWNKEGRRVQQRAKNSQTHPWG